MKCMTTRSVLLLIGIGAISAGCQDRDRRGSGKQEEIHYDKCAPFEKAGAQEGQETGGDAEPDAPTERRTYICEGQGLGWLDITIFGAGDRTTCLRYRAEEPPKEPTAADCAPISLGAVPLGIPRPAACCDGGADAEGIVSTCALDCGFAACKLAVAKIRTSAAGLEVEEGLEEPMERAREDLYALANKLEDPSTLRRCATEVAAAKGGVIDFDLGRGRGKNRGLLGHIRKSTLYIGCKFDEHEPYTLDEKADWCDEPINIPEPVEVAEGRGPIVGGTVAVVGPDVQESLQILGGDYEYRKVRNRDQSIEFHLTSFNGQVYEATIGPYYLRDIEFSLAEPAVAVLRDDLVEFAEGSVRFSVTTLGRVDGVPLLGGAPVTLEYVNTDTATATLTADGSFSFIEAPFEVGERTATLVTVPPRSTSRR
jgi:hypothetical protein